MRENGRICNVLNELLSRSFWRYTPKEYKTEWQSWDIMYKTVLFVLIRAVNNDLAFECRKGKYEISTDY